MEGYKKVKLKRRNEGRTDYKARFKLLSSGLTRFVVRKSNRYITAQLVKSKEAQDYVIITAHSRELAKYGTNGKSKKNLAAAYLTGFLLGIKAQEKEEKINKAILDINLYRNSKGSRVYACLKGVVDAGLEIPHSSDILPTEEAIKKTSNGKLQDVLEKIKSNFK